MIGTAPIPMDDALYRPGQVVRGEPRPELLPKGCHFATDYGCGSGDPGVTSTCDVTTRVVCDGGLIIHGRKIPTWTLVAAAAVAALVVFRD